MIGFIIAATLVVLRVSTDTTLPETAIIQSSIFLFWWYLVTSIVAIALTILAWANALGSEGAKIRFGIATPLSWMMGIYRMPLNNGFVFIYLLARRALFTVGSYFILISFHEVGAGFIQDEIALIGGSLLIVLGLFSSLFKPHFRNEYPEVRLEKILHS